MGAQAEDSSSAGCSDQPAGSCLHPLGPVCTLSSKLVLAEGSGGSKRKRVYKATSRNESCRQARACKLSRPLLPMARRSSVTFV
jgi:hypothetical protein